MFFRVNRGFVAHEWPLEHVSEGSCMADGLGRADQPCFCQDPEQCDVAVCPRVLALGR